MLKPPALTIADLDRHHAVIANYSGNGKTTFLVSCDDLHEVFSAARAHLLDWERWRASFPDKINWVAKDGDTDGGGWHGFENRPHFNYDEGDIWIATDDDSSVFALIGPPPGVAPDLDWRESLMELPAREAKS